MRVHAYVGVVCMIACVRACTVAYASVWLCMVVFVWAFKGMLR